jgi:hypothetical protein
MPGCWEFLIIKNFKLIARIEERHSSIDIRMPARQESTGLDRKKYRPMRYWSVLTPLFSRKSETITESVRMLRRLAIDDQALLNASSAFFRIVTLLFSIVGAFAILVSVVVLVTTANFVMQSELAVARIERIEPRAGRSVQYVPIYSFTDSSNIQHRNEGILCGRERWTVGQQVSVRYSLADHGRSLLNTFHEIWMAPTLFATFSVGYFLVSFHAYRRFSKPNKS